MDIRTASLAIDKLLILALSLISLSVSAVIPDSVDGEALPSLAPMLDQVTPAVVNIATEGKIQVRLNPLFSDPFFRRFFNVLWLRPSARRARRRDARRRSRRVLPDHLHRLRASRSHRPPALPAL